MTGLTISISELRNRFDKYMRRVKSGETIIVTKRGKPIAQFTPAKMMQRSENRIYSKGKRRDIEIWPKWAQAAVLGGVAPRLVLTAR